MTAPTTEQAHLTPAERLYLAALAETERVLAEAQQAVGDEPALVQSWLAMQVARLRVGNATGPDYRAECARLQAICEQAHDRLLRGDRDGEILDMLETAWKG